MADTPTIGQLYHTIEVQYFTYDKNANGEQIKTWVEYATIKAAMDTTGATEAEENNRLTTLEDIDFDIRTLDGINAKMRVVYDEKVYIITGIIPLSRRYQKVKAKLDPAGTDEYLVQSGDTADDTDVSSDQTTI